MARTSQRVMEDLHGPQEERKTRGAKRSAILLSPAPPAAKKRKSPDASAEVVPCRTTADLTHEMVLEDVSTAELLNLLGEFLCRRCTLIEDLSPDGPATMFRTLDMVMVTARLQKAPFLCPGTVVFLYMLCRDAVSAELTSTVELCPVLLICFYVSCSYFGPSIGYLEAPFIVEADWQAFWKRTFDITKRMSHKMLQMNISPQFFTQVLADMKNRTDH